MSGGCTGSCSIQERRSFSRWFPDFAYHLKSLSDAHSRYLESLCDYLYDDLRPRILHEPKLTVLCQVCTVIQALMVLDYVPDTGELDYEDNETVSYDDDVASTVQFAQPMFTPSLRDIKAAQTPFTAKGRGWYDPSNPSEISPSLVRHQFSPNVRRKSIRQLHIGKLLEMVLQDAQTKLFFKAQAMVQSEIRYYAPKNNDLDYPGKIISKWNHN